MKINFTKKQLHLNLIYAFLFLITGMPFLFRAPDTWMLVVALLLPISFVLKYVYQKKYQYVTIENGSIRKNNLFKKEVQLSAIKTIEKYAGSYILRTNTQKLRIDTTMIAPNSLLELNAELEKLMLNGTKSTGTKTL
jgi:hypothetical protein|tara:strand:- start:190 stop:600 length:411 start_codon:yes stop_codon:yes gene_type:complete